MDLIQIRRIELERRSRVINEPGDLIEPSFDQIEKEFVACGQDRRETDSLEVQFSTGHPDERDEHELTELRVGHREGQRNVRLEIAVRIGIVRLPSFSRRVVAAERLERVFEYLSDLGERLSSFGHIRA